MGYAAHLMDAGKERCRLLGVFTAMVAVVSACTQDQPLDPPPPPTPLLCDVTTGPALVARYSPDAPAVPCDALEPPPQTTRLEGPVLVGRSDNGTRFVIDRLVPPQPRVFMAAPGENLELANAGPRLFTSDGEVVTVEISAADTFLSGMTIQSTLVPHNGQFLATYEDASVELQLVEPMGAVETLAGVDDCAQVVSQPPPTEKWWVPEYLSEVPDTGQWLYVVAIGEFGSTVDNQHHFVFFGAPGNVEQRALTRFTRRNDGQTWIVFELDGQSATFEFPGGCEASSISHGCPGRMDLGDISMDVESRWDDFPGALEDIQLQCRFVVQPEAS